MSDFAEYQELCKRFAVYPKEVELEYLTLGLTSEAGEVAGKVKKFLRGDSVVNIYDVAKELGDVLWYLAMLASHYDLSLSDIANNNVHKLTGRKMANTIKGNGDER